MADEPGVGVGAGDRGGVRQRQARRSRGPRDGPSRRRRNWPRPGRHQRRPRHHRRVRPRSLGLDGLCQPRQDLPQGADPRTAGLVQDGLGHHQQRLRPARQEGPRSRARGAMLRLRHGQRRRNARDRLHRPESRCRCDVHRSGGNQPAVGQCRIRCGGGVCQCAGGGQRGGATDRVDRRNCPANPDVEHQYASGRRRSRADHDQDQEIWPMLRSGSATS